MAVVQTSRLRVVGTEGSPAQTRRDTGHRYQRCLPPADIPPGAGRCYSPRRAGAAARPHSTEAETDLGPCLRTRRGAGGWTGDRLGPPPLPASGGRTFSCAESGRVLSTDRPPGSPRLLLPLKGRATHACPAVAACPRARACPAHGDVCPCPGAGQRPGAASLPALQHAAGHQDVRGGCHHGPSEAAEEGTFPWSPFPPSPCVRSLATLPGRCGDGTLGRGVSGARR